MSAATAARPAGIGIGLECGRLRAVPAGRPDLGCFAVQAGNSAFDGGPFQHDPVRMRERPALSRQGAGLSSGGAAPLDEDDPGRPARRALRDAPAS
ncbi:MAG: hypothetical protein KGJ30_05315, partial [Burkholderiales bacterium]|nr:hypothetical protein [Burkholderiales bacterium]